MATPTLVAQPNGFSPQRSHAGGGAAEAAGRTHATNWRPRERPPARASFVLSLARARAARRPVIVIPSAYFARHGGLTGSAARPPRRLTPPSGASGTSASLWGRLGRRDFIAARGAAIRRRCRWHAGAFYCGLARGEAGGGGGGGDNWTGRPVAMNMRQMNLKLGRPASGSLAPL